MPETRSVARRRPRDSYSHIICLNCSERRIKCELPGEVDIPGPGELRTVQAPCYRCKRLGVPCVIRQTILGRPGSARNAVATAGHGRRVGGGDAAPQIIIDLSPEAERQLSTRSAVPSRPARSLLSIQGDSPHINGGTLFLRRPQSGESLLIIHALETLRRENVQELWYRHLPSRFGQSKALDLSIKALVVACAFSRGTPTITYGDCRQALALALEAVKEEIKRSPGRLDDLALAATALLIPFEGIVGMNRVPTRAHVNGLAAMLVARPADYPVSQLAREILDFQAVQSGIRACLLDSPSPFENVAAAYYASADGDGDEARLKALGTELFLRIPRLVMLVRSLRAQRFLQSRTLLDALRLSGSLLRLQDPQSEERLLRRVKVATTSDSCEAETPGACLQFDSVEVFKALSYCWQGRLSLLNLLRCLHDLQGLDNARCDESDVREVSLRSQYGSRTNETTLLANNLLMCSEYAGKLRLLKHRRLFAHAMVAVWGAYMNDRKSQGGLSSRTLQGITCALRAEPPLTGEDMDIAADLFVGGPCKGRFADIFGL